VSWQLVSFLILAVVLLGGFAWYERSRPPAQVVALVAALAALAIAGRIAFAAFPNVKPTTDIVIFAGYALGPAAGFAVGALAALVSNFWFGQGPWTPWQMAAWGLCGILGAALALGTRNVGRLTLAAVCGLAAVGYGAILNFSLMATYGGQLSWRSFLIYEGRAVPFEVAHAAGNIVFALAAGPAMIRMLIRFRERFEWRRAAATVPIDRAAVPPGGGAPDPAPEGAHLSRHPALSTGRVVALLLAVLVLGAFASTHAHAAGASGPEAAAAWLDNAQNEDGGFGDEPGAASGQEMTGWAMLGLEAAGVNPQDVVSGKGRSPVDYLQAQVASVQSPGDLARTILALEGARVEPREFGSRNLVAALLAKRRKDGSYEDWPNSTAYAVLALRSAGIANVADSLEWLRGVQNEDGGWGDTAGSPSNPDGTGAVLQALSPSSQAAKRGVGYLRQVQQPGGGFRLGGNGALNTQSSAWAVEGLLAAGANPAEFKRGGKSALDYLEDNQDADGHYRYSSKSDQTPVWVTGQVVVATSKKYLPLEAPPRVPQPKPSPSTVPTPTPQTESIPTPLPEVGGVTPVPSTTSEVPLEDLLPPTSGHGTKGAQGKNGNGKGTSSGGVGVGGSPTAELPGTEPGAIPEEGSTIEPGTGESTAAGGPGEATTEPRSDSGGGSVLGSIIAGLIAGGVLFAIGYGPYRRWQSTRGKPGGTPPPGPGANGNGAAPGAPAAAGPQPINAAPAALPPPTGAPVRAAPPPPRP
jgi:energy-coupling factor transport system substrate-specific component